MVIKTSQQLQTMYMPFITNGGIFVTDVDPSKYNLGDKIIISITLPLAERPEVINGCIFWITPTGAQIRWPPSGVGVQLSHENALIQKKIETLLR